ncbi:1-deoxy-D-xylulose 5-phosphate reductoisomerase [Lachnospiraceae bacterium A10]|jgi:1-deoxy-D-xylulose-5-phosphate reductoisomerase|nr:1-deoxy-D-xylulose 5-phosphate reductoisomerase [Lachnospiraceae bacterium A10]
MKKIAILGSTGSIGTQTLEIVREQGDLIVTSMSCGRNIDLFEKQIREFKPKFVSVGDADSASELKKRIADLKIEVLYGMDGLIAVATDAESEILVTAIVGMLGVRPTIAAIEAGKDIALANKETLVTAGHIIMPLAKQKGVSILPVDSEHSAIFQSLQGNEGNDIHRILLTCSGGPFRGRSYESLEGVTVEDALNHPNWSMGRKITIDSATLINKGLEVMEAKWLFHVDPGRIQVLVHPQSILHSAVEFEDGGVMGQMGLPNMKLPIQYALYYPKRREMEKNYLDLFEVANMTFEKPDMETFYGLQLAYDALEAGGNVPTVFNAANERAVQMFLDRKISFLEIPETIQKAMLEVSFITNPSVEDILATEKETNQVIDSFFA